MAPSLPCVESVGGVVRQDGFENIGGKTVGVAGVQNFIDKSGEEAATEGQENATAGPALSSQAAEIFPCGVGLPGPLPSIGEQLDCMLTQLSGRCYVAEKAIEENEGRCKDLEAGVARAANASNALEAQFVGCERQCSKLHAKRTDLASRCEKLEERMLALLQVLQQVVPQTLESTGVLSFAKGADDKRQGELEKEVAVLKDTVRSMPEILVERVAAQLLGVVKNCTANALTTVLGNALGPALQKQASDISQEVG